MEQNQVKELDALDSKSLELTGENTSILASGIEKPADLPLSSCPKASNNTEGNCQISNTYIYALGRIQPRFPSLAVEKEFAQAVGRIDTKGQTDLQTLHSVLSIKQNRYLSRQICWVMTIEGLETYILHPRDPTDFDILIEAIRPAPSRNDIDIVIGIKGPIASSKMCNGLMVPIVLFDQIYSLDVDALIKTIPRPEKRATKEFESASLEVFDRIMQIADNSGATDESRALNYLAVRYPVIYTLAAKEFEDNCSLTSIEVLPSRLSGVRKVMDVVFTYTNRTTDMAEKFFVRVDVTEKFPFLVTKMSPYYAR
jgi:hypothetical protein